MKSTDRKAMTRAVDRIERLLAADPTHGHHLAEGLFKLSVAPVTVYYEIHTAKAAVTATAIAVA
jgi:hypothetical protein